MLNAFQRNSIKCFELRVIVNEKELFEKQYGGKKFISTNSFPFLRKAFKKYDLHREDLALRLIEDASGKLLDVGCGSGSLAFRAKEKFEEVIGIDISPSRIEEAQKSAIEKYGENNNLRFQLCNLNEGISFSDNMFDAATSIAVIGFVFDPYFVVDEICRVLKPGGILVID